MCRSQKTHIGDYYDRAESTDSVQKVKFQLEEGDLQKCIGYRVSIREVKWWRIGRRGPWSLPILLCFETNGVLFLVRCDRQGSEFW